MRRAARRWSRARERALRRCGVRAPLGSRDHLDRGCAELPGAAAPDRYFTRRVAEPAHRGEDVGRLVIGARRGHDRETYYYFRSSVDLGRRRAAPSGFCAVTGQGPEIVSPNVRRRRPRTNRRSLTHVIGASAFHGPRMGRNPVGSEPTRADWHGAERTRSPEKVAKSSQSPILSTDRHRRQPGSNPASPTKVSRVWASGGFQNGLPANGTR